MKLKQTILIIAIILVIILIGWLLFGYYQKLTYHVSNPIATIEVENYGAIKVELYPDMAPNTVANFIKLAQNGSYNNSTFHRVVKDFMIQGGSMKGDSTSSPTLQDLDINNDAEEYCIEGEMAANGHSENTLRHEEGVLSMARVDYTSLSSTLTKESYNSGNSQFFIMTKNTPSLNGLYAAFGRVIEGMDIVHQIENTELSVNKNEETGEETTTDSPVNPPKITSITVETFGVDYGMPETMEPFDQQSWMYEQLGIQY